MLFTIENKTEKIFKRIEEQSVLTEATILDLRFIYKTTSYKRTYYSVLQQSFIQNKLI